MWYSVVALVVGWTILPILALVFARRVQREAAELRDRIQRLEYLADRDRPLPLLPTGPEAAIHSPVVGALANPVTLPPPAIPQVPSAAMKSFFDHAHAEEMVGGLWLQNIGAVLVLLGAFFSIVWGYTTGRLGAGALVLAGVLLGAALAWRGDRLARTLAPIGHTLIGVGLGVIYISIHVGWVSLHVMSAPVAMALLATVALVSVWAGLHYRSQPISALGVLGAFVPPVVASTLHILAFALTPTMLFGYMVIVDLVLMVLAARMGWSLLDLLAITLTTLTWLMTNASGTHDWGLQVGLAALYAVAGLAPVVRLARTPEPASPAELGVIAAAPVLFAIASWPFIERVGPVPSAVLLLSLAAIQAAAAWWIDTRRESDDAWRPLTAAAAVFVGLALARWAGEAGVSLAWLAEGAALVWLGAGRRGAWLRACGAAVSLVGGCAHLILLAEPHATSAGTLPFVNPRSLRVLGGITLLLVTAAMLAREDRFRTEWRRLLGRTWVVAAMLMLLVHLSIEAELLARRLGHASDTRSMGMLQAFLTSALWTLQAAALMVFGWRRRSAFVRWLGLSLLGLTVLKFVLGDLSQVDVFWRFVSAVLVGVTLLIVSFFYQRRMRRGGSGSV